MEELIKEAESLYQQIDKIQLDLVKSRLDVCEEQKWKAISEMETAMCAVFQFLKCLIERKDNIVDLGEVWHTLDLKSKHDIDIAYLDIVVTVDNEILKEITTLNSLCNWLRYNPLSQGRIKWAFWKDLLPKGGN